MGRPTIVIDMDAPQHEWDAFITRLERIAAGEEEPPEAPPPMVHPMMDPAEWIRSMYGGGSG